MEMEPENILIQESDHVMLVDFDLPGSLPAADPTRNNKNPDPVKDRMPKRRHRRRRQLVLLKARLRSATATRSSKP